MQVCTLTIAQFTRPADPGSGSEAKNSSFATKVRELVFRALHAKIILYLFPISGRDDIGNVTIIAHQRIRTSTVCSTEPGFYLDGEFGIRLETIMAVVKAKTPVSTFKRFG